MAKFDKNSSPTIGDVSITVTGRGVSGQVTEGIVGRQRGAVVRDPIDNVFAELDDFGSGGVERRAEFSIEVDRFERGTRGGGTGEQPAVLFRVPGMSAEEPHVAIVEDDGFRYIIRPDSEGQFEIPVAPSEEAERGLTQIVGRYAVRVIAMVAAKAVAKGAQLTVGAIEENRRPHRLRSFTTTDHLTKEAALVDPTTLAGANALLLIHGFNSAAHNAFRFDREYVGELHRRYGGRVAAFDHPSLCLSPRENAEWLATHLEGTGLEQLDILAHSRGGLVARELLDVLDDSGVIRSVVFVATPNNGTALADPDHLDDFVSMAANLTSLVPDNPVTDTIGIGLELIREWLLPGLADTFTGIECARPSSEVLDRLGRSSPGETAFRAIASRYEPRRGEGAVRRAADFVMDRAFRGTDNDLLVPTRSAYDKRDEFHVPSDDRLVLDGSFGVSHSTFWSERMVLQQLDQWLDPAITKPQPADARFTDPGAEFELATRTGDVELIRTARAVAEGDVLGLAAKLVGGALDRPAHRGAAGESRGANGAVVVLPGILGSRLRVIDGDPDTTAGDEVWLNTWALVRGHFGRLEHPSREGRHVLADGLLPQYTPLLSRLADSWDVFPFAYDWRLDIDETAETLASFLDEHGIDPIGSERPVHFVGHSMGGLVARAYLRDHPEALRPNGGRLVQLGTPNLGSFATLAAVLGDDIALRAVAAADVVNGKDELRRVFCSFPSVYQLLPSPIPPEGAATPEHARLYDDPSWHDDPTSIRHDLVEAALSFHERMRDVTADERFVFVAGDGIETAHRAKLEPSGKVSFGITTRGDGRVTHELAYEGLGIAPERTFFVGARHGDLASNDRVLNAIDDLLRTGTTELLASEPGGGRRGTVDDTGRRVTSDELERSLGLPVPYATRGARVDEAATVGNLEIATKLYVGGGEATPMAPALRVRVVHCSLEQAKYPVAAGRYKGIPMEGAIAFLDRRLAGALTELQQLDLSPEEAGTSRYVPPPNSTTWPKGAIVVGLGEFGQLSSTQLTRGIESGTIEYALAQRRASQSKSELGVSSVLIGTPGRYGLSVQSSVLATIRGVARAAARLNELGVVVDELELIELYEGKAEEAALALHQLAAANRFAGMEVQIATEPMIDGRPGGRPGSGGYEESGAPWLRLQLHIKDPEQSGDAERPRAAAGGPDAEEGADRGAETSKSRTLTWVSLGRSSQAEHLQVRVPVKEIQGHVRSAVHDPSASSTTNLTLFEMLFPHGAKLELDERDNLHLLVDETTAWIPWELVTGRDTNANLLEPLARRAGVLRQLIPLEAERPRRTFRPIGKKALVIGDPPGDPRYWPRLPGARDEARVVAKILDDAGYDVTELIYEGDREASPEIATEIRNAFFGEHYRVIHIAGHGTFEEDSADPFDNGVVIGPDEVLCAGHFEDRLVTPDLVFLNCCHIGRIDAPDPATRRRRSSYADLAASTSLQLMKIGVRAVVAAGWAVDDKAAWKFASTFYERMVAGTVFGDSVRDARDDAYDDRSNTWGAYQCYGDPDFQFPSPPGRSSQESQAVLSEAHLLKQLKALEMMAGDADESAYAAGIAASLRGIEDEHGERFRSAAVWEAFARAYAAAGAFDDAVFCYRKAVDAESATASIRALEQLANLESRLAALIERGKLPGERRVRESEEELCRLAETRLDGLISTVGRTPERLALKGSLYKRWANIAGADRREELLRAARDAYGMSAKPAAGATTVSIYHGCLAVQLAYIAGVGDLPDRASKARPLTKRDFRRYERMLKKQLAGLDPAPTEGNYFQRARWIDIHATLVIAAGEITKPDRADEIVTGFRTNFAIRSTARERRSVIDHYAELSRLLPAEDERAAAAEIARRLDD